MMLSFRFHQAKVVSVSIDTDTLTFTPACIRHFRSLSPHFHGTFAHFRYGSVWSLSGRFQRGSESDGFTFAFRPPAFAPDITLRQIQASTCTVSPSTPI
jgi:hypothetical protein